MEVEAEMWQHSKKIQHEILLEQMKIKWREGGNLRDIEGVTCNS